MNEYTYKINDPSFDNKFSYKHGEAFFTSMSYATDGFSILLQGKRIDNMSFRSDRNESLQSLLINYLPANTKQHTYTMLALNPYATQLKGEIGGMAEIQYKFKKGTPLGGHYGTEITLNISKAHGLKTIGVNDSSTQMTFYRSDWVMNNKLNIGKDYYSDFFIEINKKITKEWKATLVYSNQFYDRNIVQFGATNTGYKNLKTHIAVADITYRYKPGKTLRLETQGLFTENKFMISNSNLVATGSWATALIEWTPTSNWFFAVYDQFNYGNVEKDLRIHYYLGTFGYNKDAHRIQVSYGKQSAGIFCVGGVCRTVPASNGITLSITSSF
jgi:hypothetical protein